MEWFLIIVILIMVSYHNMIERNKWKVILKDRMDDHERYISKLQVHNVNDKFTYVTDGYGGEVYKCMKCNLHVWEEYTSIKSRESHICKEKKI